MLKNQQRVPRIKKGWEPLLYCMKKRSVRQGQGCVYVKHLKRVRVLKSQATLNEFFVISEFIEDKIGQCEEKYY